MAYKKISDLKHWPLGQNKHNTKEYPFFYFIFLFPLGKKIILGKNQKGLKKFLYSTFRSKTIYS